MAALVDGGATPDYRRTPRFVPGRTANTVRLYARFAELVSAGAIDVDLAPMRHVADAFTLGRRLASRRSSGNTHTSEGSCHDTDR